MAKEEESASISLPQSSEQAEEPQAHIELTVETKQLTVQTKPSANEQDFASASGWSTPRDINRELAARIAEGKEPTWEVLGIPSEAALNNAHVTSTEFLAQLDVFNKRLLAREKVAAQIKQLRADYPRYKHWLDELQMLRNEEEPWAVFHARSKAEHQKRQFDELVVEARVHLKDRRLDWAEHQKMLQSASLAGLSEADVERAYVEAAGSDFERELTEPVAPRLDLSVEVTHVPVINYPLAQSCVPVVSEMRISNTGMHASGRLELVVEVEPDLADVYTQSIGRIRPDETVELQPLGLLRADRLRTIAESQRADLLWELRDAGSVVSSGRSTIQVLPYNEWPGLRAPVGLLACFVTPQHSAVVALVANVQERLLQRTGDGTISGYLYSSPTRIRETVRTLYEAIQAAGIVDRGMAANYSDNGQRVQLADSVLRDRRGNTLDLTILVASCLEQMGISPLIVIQRDRAFPGAWLSQDRFYEGTVYDCARLRMTSELGQAVFFDPSALSSKPHLSLEAAERNASEAFSTDAQFLCALDVSAVRDRYHSLTLEEQTSSPTAQVEEGAAVRRTVGVVAKPANVRQTQGTSRAAPLNERFKTWREKLLDLSLRNKLLNFVLDGKSALALSVPDIARLEDLLAADHAFEVQPRPTKRLDRNVVLQNMNSDVLQSTFDDTKLARQATQLKRSAVAAIEEGGANVLYLALGFLKWFENDSSESERLAPLLLIPVTLESARETRKIQLRRLPEETLPNWTLVEKMRADFGLDLEALGEIEADESGLDVSGMLEMVRQRILNMKRWEVLEDAHVGVFSFAKYLMWRDLGDNQDVLLENRVIRHIATRPTGGFQGEKSPLVPHQMDDLVSPAQLPLVVDSDSTQTMAVVAAVTRGQSFVLQGPPGTGKSQTITNLIAAALASEKSVLFVSEKMAALEVVYRRLQSVGLADFCLELHSHKAQKREVVQSLGKTLDRSERTVSARWEEESAEVASMRSQLNAYARALHAATPLGETLHEATARLLTMHDVPLIRLRRQNPSHLTSEQLKQLLELATSFGLAASKLQSGAVSPFHGCLVESWSGQLERDTHDALDHALMAIDRLDHANEALCSALDLERIAVIPSLTELAHLTQRLAIGPVPRSWRSDNDWNHLRELVHAWSDALATQERRQNDLALRWKPSLYRAELVELEALFQRWANAFVLLAWLFLFTARRRLASLAATGLPGSRQIAADLHRAREVNAAEPAIEDAHRQLQRAFDGCGPSETLTELETIMARGNGLREAVRGTVSLNGLNLGRALALADPESSETERARLRSLASQVVEAIAAYQDSSAKLRNLLAMTDTTFGAQESQDLGSARVRLESWKQNMGSYRDWCLYQAARRALVTAGCGAITDAHAQGAISSAQCASACERALLDEWVVATRDANPALRSFDGVQHHALVERFSLADTKHIRRARERVVSLLESRLPPRTGDAAGEPAILRRELAKKRNHMPLRKLLQAIPYLLPKLKPCLLMSPLSVAQYLPARGRRFDLVVFDEASQICTHDAIGAIGRGNQLVVVGDSKQLPPTAFFARAASDEGTVDENDFTELESVLDEARASGMPEQMLGWHYRSRHETLIEFSNQHYYESRLNVFPAARGAVADLGIKFHLVQGGVYELGRSRTNPREARTLVDFLVQELRHTAATARTFGVVTFSSVQQELIEDLLEEARKKYPEIEPHFADQHPSFEKVFVKNLENVQGDERDEILFSIAYAPDEQGKMLMNFGPVNRDGGERRLNVAATRARKQLRVFSSITADQIDTNRTRSTGARHLKSFLRYAAERSTSKQDRVGERAGVFDSQFESEIYDVLRASGYEVDTQVGCGSYRIDLAVFHPKMPGVYALGIECDGAAYHSAATARDRDRLRQQILEGLGWRLHRVWSTDWIYRREHEVERLQAAVERACQRSVIRSPAPPPPISAAPTVVVAHLPAAESPVVPYQRAKFKQVSDEPDDMYEQSQLPTLQRYVADVLRMEAPVHLDEVTRRVGEAYNVQRIGARPRKRIQEIVNMTRGYVCRDEFIWDAAATRGLDMRVREDKDRNIEMIPLEEIAAAARWVILQALSISETDLVKETVRVFGIQRRGAKVEARARLGVELLFQSPHCKRDGEYVTWRG